ncbi:hypothetical protein SAMN04487972_12053 [Paracoccus halophilus]|uniref:Uncharacterized protein n=1 Tax=Paracoccus halophilus TaxID=376733 RepID=A0A099EUR8_9RHOB|nr:hypothetical protein [Paracoccus halophilus]KGJ02130.1 hypothetical protein IT41_18390 [Paracoccus halophilus]SFA58445.1 hypothetical protein SAMN04487972_12053 [Paracoccus halophilus]
MNACIATEALHAYCRCSADQDAELVIGAILEECRAGTPATAFDQIEDEAENWAALATFDEASAYFLACGRRLTDFPLGPKCRVRMAVRMLEGLPPEDQGDALKALATAIAPTLCRAA